MNIIYCYGIPLLQNPSLVSRIHPTLVMNKPIIHEKALQKRMRKSDNEIDDVFLCVIVVCSPLAFALAKYVTSKSFVTNFVTSSHIP